MYTLKLKTKKNEYGGVNTYIFEPQKTVPFRAGQYCHLLIPNMPVFSRHIRKICFASSPSDKDIVFSINGSSGSLWHQKMMSLESGDRIRILGSRAHGNMTFPEDPTRPVICIAGGVGITPFRSLLRSDIGSKTSRNITFVHVASAGYLYEKEFLKYPIQQYRIRRNDIEKTLHKTVPKYPLGSYLIAGPPQFVRAVAVKLVALGISEENIQGHKLRKHRIDRSRRKRE
jgi:ferredoxin-NADP reductase